MSRLIDLPETQLRAEFVNSFDGMKYLCSEDASWQVAQIYARRDALIEEMKRRGLIRTLAMLLELHR